MKIASSLSLEQQDKSLLVLISLMCQIMCSKSTNSIFGTSPAFSLEIENLTWHTANDVPEERELQRAWQGIEHAWAYARERRFKVDAMTGRMGSNEATRRFYSMVIVAKASML